MEICDLDSLVARLRMCSIDVQLPGNEGKLIRLMQLVEEILAFIEEIPNLEQKPFDCYAFFQIFSELHTKSTSNDTFHLLTPYLGVTQENIQILMFGDILPSVHELELLLPRIRHYLVFLLTYVMEPLVNSRTTKDESTTIPPDILYTLRDQLLDQEKIHPTTYDFSLGTSPAPEPVDDDTDTPTETQQDNGNVIPLR